MRKKFIPTILAISFVILNACTPSGTVNPPANQNPASGGKIKIENWPVGQTGRLSFQFDPFSTTTSLANVPVGNDGSSEYALPTTLTSNLGLPNAAYSGVGCANTVVGTPSDVRITRPFAPLGFVGASTSSTGTIFLSNNPSPFTPTAGFNFAQHVYAERDVVVSGKLDCAREKSTYSFSLSLKAGWNFALTETKTVNAVDGSSTFEIIGSDKEPVGLKWYYVANVRL